MELYENEQLAAAMMAIHKGSGKTYHRIDSESFRSPSSSKYIYFITLTCPHDEKDDPSFLQKRVNTIIQSKQFQIKSFVYSYELTKEGVPHCHMIVWTDKYVDASKVLKLNNKNRIDCQKVRSVSAVSNYITKTKSEVEINYFNLNNISIVNISPTCPLDINPSIPTGRTSSENQPLLVYQE